MKNADRIEAGLTDVTQGRTHWIFAAAGAVGAAGVIWTMQVLTIRSDLDQVISDIFFQYAGLALAIERAAAVFVAMTRDRLRVDLGAEDRPTTAGPGSRPAPIAGAEAAL